MRRMAPSRIAALIFSLGAAAAASAEPPHPSVRVGLVLDVLDVAPPMPEAQLREMDREAEAIWAGHGVALVVARSAGAAGPQSADVWIVVDLAPTLQTGAAVAHAGRLGAIVFDEQNVPASAVTLQADAIAMIVAGVRWIGRPMNQWPPTLLNAVIGRALGRVLAHELGHYLLASRTHRPDGLMRASFDGELLSRPDRGAFAVAARDLPRLRARLARLGRTVSVAENPR
jgi:hypothetical protein